MKKIKQKYILWGCALVALAITFLWPGAITLPVLLLFSQGGGGESQSRPATGPERTEVFNAGLKGIGGQLGFPSTGGTADVSRWGQLTGTTTGGTVPQFSFPTYKAPGTVSAGSMQQAKTPYFTPTARIEDPGNPTGVSYVNPGGPYAFSDYEALMNSITAARTAPLNRYETLQREALDEDLSRRGIWASPVSAAAQNDLTEAFLPQYEQAGAEAATQTYNLMAQELARLSDYGLTAAGQENTFNLQNAAETDQQKLARTQMLNDLYAGQAQSQNTFNLQTFADALQQNQQTGEFNLANASMQNQLAQNTAQNQYQSAWEPYNWLSGLFNQTGGAFSTANQGGSWSFL